MTENVSKPEPVDTSHKDPSYAAQAPKETDNPEPEQEAPETETETEEGEQNESEQSAATETAEGAPPKPRGVQKRLDELTKARHDAEREKEYWREMAMRQQNEPQKPAQSQETSDEPTLEGHDFDVAAFTKAWAKWDRQQEAKQAEQAKANEAAAARTKKYQDSAAEFAAQNPDYQQVVSNPYLPMTQDMVDAITEADNPAAVAYHLAKNPSEAERIAGLTVAGIGRAIGKIEAELSSSVPSPPIRKTVTNAPPPPSTLSGSVSAKPRYEDMSMAEYDRQRGDERKSKGLRP